MINRILDRLEEELDESGVIDDDDYFLGMYNAYNDAISIVKEESQNGGWIPCEKALPPVTTIYLVTKKQNDDGVVETDCQRFYAGASKWDCELYENDWKVIAWQDAPEPYKGVE